MSYEIIQKLVDQLEHENPNVRIRALRHLAALGDPSAITAISNVYLNEDELPRVKKVARETLGVFQAIKEALDQNVDVELPDPATVRPPRLTPEFLRRLLVVLAVLMVVFWVVDVALYFLPILGQGPRIDAQAVLGQLRARYEQVRQDADNQRASWQQLQSGGALNCALPQPAPGSTNSNDLKALQLDPATYPALHQANLAMIAAIDRLTLVAGNWLVSCSAGIATGSAEESLGLLGQVAASLEQARDWLDQAQAALAAEPMPGSFPDGGPGAGQPTATAEGGPSPEPSATAGPTTAPATDTPLPINYRAYIQSMRERIDLVLSGRGVVTQLTQYWADIRRSGQSFGCRQVFEMQDLVAYDAVTAEDAALDPRLLEVSNALNLGLLLARESLTRFQQGCASGNFAPVLDMGEQQAQQAATALTQASAMLDQLQAEVIGNP